MIIDVILDRNGYETDGLSDWYGEDQMKELYDYATFFEFEDLARALDMGGEDDVKRELCEYIDSQGYPPGIKDYINDRRWVVVD